MGNGNTMWMTRQWTILKINHMTMVQSNMALQQRHVLTNWKRWRWSKELDHAMAMAVVFG